MTIGMRAHCMLHLPLSLQEYKEVIILCPELDCPSIPETYHETYDKKHQKRKKIIDQTAAVVLVHSHLILWAWSYKWVLSLKKQGQMQL